MRMVTCTAFRHLFESRQSERNQHDEQRDPETYLDDLAKEIMDDQIGRDNPCRLLQERVFLPELKRSCQKERTQKKHKSEVCDQCIFCMVGRKERNILRQYNFPPMRVWAFDTQSNGKIRQNDGCKRCQRPPGFSRSGPELQHNQQKNQKSRFSVQCSNKQHGDQCAVSFLEEKMKG